MAAGYELLTPEPSEINLRDIAHYPQVRILNIDLDNWFN